MAINIEADRLRIREVAIEDFDGLLKIYNQQEKFIFHTEVGRKKTSRAAWLFRKVRHNVRYKQ